MLFVRYHCYHYHRYHHILNIIIINLHIILPPSIHHLIINLIIQITNLHYFIMLASIDVAAELVTKE